MENIFNIKRMGLILQRYLILRKRWEIIYWSILIFIFMFISTDARLMALFLIASGVFYAAQLPKELHNKVNGIHYLTIPASGLEKLIALILTSIVYYFIMLIVAYIIGNMLGTLFNNLFSNFFSFFQKSSLTWGLFKPSGQLFSFWGELAIDYPPNFLWRIFLIFTASQSIFLLGGIYYKRNAAAKTILACVGLLFLVAFTLMFVLSIGDDLGWVGIHKYPGVAYWAGLSMFGKVVEFIGNVFIYLSIPIFFIISYVRLTEKQI